MWHKGHSLNGISYRVEFNYRACLVLYCLLTFRFIWKTPDPNPFNKTSFLIKLRKMIHVNIFIISSYKFNILTIRFIDSYGPNTNSIID